MFELRVIYKETNPLVSSAHTDLPYRDSVFEHRVIYKETFTPIFLNKFLIHFSPKMLEKHNNELQLMRPRQLILVIENQ